MEYNISNIIQIFVKNYPDLYKAMQVEHGYNGVDANPHHLEGSVWTHTCMVMKEAENSNKVQMLAALCHDIGKAFVYEDKPETERRRFFSHEAVSTFYTKEVLSSFNITTEERNRVLKIVSQHGSLYNFFSGGRIPKENYIRVADIFPYEDFSDLVEFYKFDHDGRFWCTEKSKRDDELYDDFHNILDIMRLKENIRTAQDIVTINNPTIKILIGPPRVGKSTWVNKNIKNETVISRDAYIENHDIIGSEVDCSSCLGKGSYETSINQRECETYICKECLGTGKKIIQTYSDVWSNLTEKMHKEIDKSLQADFQRAIKSKDDIIVDMTNMSKNSRKKWLSDSRIKDYNKEAFVFIDSKSCLLSRNRPDKTIPEYVIDSMMKRFVFPNYEEFDKITIV